MKELTTEMRHKLRPILYGIVAISVGLFLIGVVVVVAEIREFTRVSSQNTQLIRNTQVSNTDTLNTSKATLDLVTSCVVEGGECYEDNQKRTNSILGDFSTVVSLSASLAVACGYTVPDRGNIRQVQACVDAGLVDAGYPVNPRPKRP